MNGLNPQRAKWNARYEAAVDDPQPSQVLLDYQHLLPSAGVALDLACGLGGNAMFLAARGFDVHAWDISNVAIDKLRQRVSTASKVHAKVVDLEQAPLGAACFDVVTVSRFLYRPLFGGIVKALKPGGMLFYQTFLQEKSAEIGPGNADYLLAENELLRVFSGLRVLAYREEGLVGDVSQGFRNEAMIVVKK